MISCGRGGGLAFQVMRRYNNMLSALAGGRRTEVAYDRIQ